MKIGESICDYCLHGEVCDFCEIVPSDLTGHDRCRHPQQDMFLGFVRTKDELPPDREDIVMIDEEDNPFIGLYFADSKRLVDENTNEEADMPIWWLKGLDWF